MRIFEGYQRGVNLGGWLSQCVSYDEKHFEGFITKKDIETIASYGLDHVRLPVDYDVFMKEQSGQDVVNEEGMSRIKHITFCFMKVKDHSESVIITPCYTVIDT